jgi:hypothetical protein
MNFWNDDTLFVTYAYSIKMWTRKNVIIVSKKKKKPLINKEFKNKMY